VLAAQRRLSDRAPAVVIITLDPWRDTPNRLDAIAKDWSMGTNAYLLSGPPTIVERSLNAWRIPRVRNEETGALSHPAIVYVVGPDGRIAYVVQGNASAIAAAVRAL
jgi:cytochrome oxidase Cu insertion factor (SCO1/SenC/PrrC family)